MAGDVFHRRFWYERHRLTRPIPVQIGEIGLLSPEAALFGHESAVSSTLFEFEVFPTAASQGHAAGDATLVLGVSAEPAEFGHLAALIENLIPATASQGHTAANVVIVEGSAGSTNVAVAFGEFGHDTEDCVLGPIGVSADGAEQGHESVVDTFTIVYRLTIFDGQFGHAALGPAVAHVSGPTPDPAVHGHVAGAASLTSFSVGVIPPDRTFIVQAERRDFVVPSENRVFIV